MPKVRKDKQPDYMLRFSSMLDGLYLDRKHKWIWIPANQGKQVQYFAGHKEPALEWLQNCVGGLIEPISSGRYSGYCNEEGLLHSLPLNPRASSFFLQPLVGDILLKFRKDLIDGEPW